MSNTSPLQPAPFASLEETSDLLSWIVNSTSDWIWSVDALAFGVLSYNESFRRYFFEQRGIVLTTGMRPVDLFPPESPFIAKWHHFFQQAVDLGSFSTDYEVFAGSHVLSLELHRLERNGQAVAISVFAKDVTQATLARRQLHKERQDALESQVRERLILDSIPQAVFWKDLDGRYLGCNATFAQAAGMASAEEVIGLTDQDLPWRPEDRQAYRRDDLSVVQSGQPHLHITETIRQADGRCIVADTSKLPLLDPERRVYGVLGIFEDITERHQAEQIHARVARALRTLSSANEALVRAEHEDGLLQGMVRILVEVGQYNGAWVGRLATDMPGAADTAQAAAGHAVPLTFQPAEHPLVARALQTGQVQLQHTHPEKDGDAKAATGSMLVLPLLMGEARWGVMCVESRDDDAFQTDEAELLGRLADDLAYGLHHLRTARQQREASAQLKNSLQEMVGVIAATVESRDPYTAGHQRRVAALARAIATELKLSPDEVEGIELGALVHDLGNMQVPAGILARPGTLAKAEFDLVKTHPQIGYDILKDVHLPWPVATMVHQHHERLDGSGYPQGLRGESIAMGTRIIAVADVVDAMVSHRPYRAQLTLAQALAEIESNKGVRYDADVVDACVELVRSGRFSIQDAT